MSMLAGWRGLLWIGAIVAAFGLVIAVTAPLVGMLATYRKIESMDVPTPQDLGSPQSMIFTWVLRGLVIASFGVALFPFGLWRLRRAGGARPTGDADWGA